MKRSAIKETVIKREIREADGATYSYALIMSESKKVASYKIPLYSIGIEMVDAYGNETSAQTSDLFADVGKAIVFYRRMIDNLVTPLNLPYIIEDEMQ